MADSSITAKQAAVLAFVFSAAALILTALARPCDIWTIFLDAVIYFCFVPMVVLGIYMVVTGRGGRWINGIDWERVGRNRQEDYVSYLGLWIAVGSAVMMVGLAAIMWNLLVTIGLIVLGTVLILVPFAVVSGERGPSRVPARRQFTRKEAGALTLAALLVATVPTGLLMAEHSSESAVAITLGAEDFTVTAPMFDHTFSYEGVDSLELVENFDHGRRIAGYATGTISSGHYRNETLGDYELASYSQVSSCIVIFVGGAAYAFNQSYETATVNLYAELQERTGL